MNASPLDLLLPYQRAWVEDTARFKAGIMSRQVGKDFSSAAEIALDCFTRPKTNWMIAAPSERQSLASLAKVKEWTQALNLAVESAGEVRETQHGQALLKSAEINFANGAKVVAVPGKPDTVRGESANVLLTEFAFFERPEETWRAILPSITNPLRGGEKKMRVISTPNGKGNRFHKIVRDNYRGPGAELDTPLDLARAMKWSVHRITIHDAVRMGLPIDVEQLREAIDDPLGWKQEFECEFLDGANVLLPYELIALAEHFEATTVCDPAFFLGSSRQFPIYVGIDFGRTTDPTVCITLERIGGILWVREVLVIHGMPSDQQLALLGLRIGAAQRVCYDYTGPGIGLGDFIVEKYGQWKPEAHKFGKVELCTFTTGFKREIFPRLRQQFEAPTTIRVPIDIEFREDLHAYQQIIRGGEFTYTAPRTAAGHSDRGTALALAVRAADAPMVTEFESVRGVGADYGAGGRRYALSRGGIWT